MKTDASPDRQCGGAPRDLRVTLASPGDGGGRIAVLLLDFQVDFLLAGVYANACVLCTARGALKRGYRVTVLRDAVAAASDAKRVAALRKMQRQGVEVADSAAVLGSAPS